MLCSYKRKEGESLKETKPKSIDQISKPTLDDGVQKKALFQLKFRYKQPSEVKVYSSVIIVNMKSTIS